MMSSHLERPGTWLRPTGVGGLLVVLGSTVLSTAAYGVLGEYVRIRWSVGVHYGPEYAPTAIVLGGFPVVVAALYVGSTGLARHLEGTDEFEDVRRSYEFAVFTLLGFLVAVQTILIGANLYPGVSN
ncbi:putative membrane protein [Halalkaliarchaeum sp. AArc-CO]|uniref:hypothetical protein n=1 Tax=Halalkaliarchaeum sp. AArc-CO TaxID=2866381 RepID=UPI00217D8F95|nr:hypothetical protein [Halalkaliarchaeum sp. AArc-CO]UWG51307.1 putative membrane protein [Halalkaliarchaeum sp. AArc-CO]